MKFWSEQESKRLVRIIKKGITKEKLRGEFPDKSWDSIDHKFRRLGYKQLDKYLKVEKKTKNSTLTKQEVIDVELKKEKEENLLNELSNRGWVSTKTRDYKQDLTYEIKLGKREKIAAISCSHFGSQYQQITHLKSFYKLCKKRGITKILSAGDFTDGNGKTYRGQSFEMFVHGADNQARYVVENYPKEKGITTYAIGGNHDYSFYKSGGYDVMKTISEHRKDIKYLGMFGAYIKVGNLSKCIYLMHKIGGVAYARSYHLQRIISEMSPQMKPNILLVGGDHVSNYLPSFRNVQGILLPCFQAQTPNYMKPKGIYPDIAGVILEFTYNNKGLTSFKPEWIFFFEPIEGDF